MLAPWSNPLTLSLDHFMATPISGSTDVKRERAMSAVGRPRSDLIVSGF